MTVQTLIEKLNGVEDKSIEIWFQDFEHPNAVLEIEQLEFDTLVIDRNYRPIAVLS